MIKPSIFLAALEKIAKPGDTFHAFDLAAQLQEVSPGPTLHRVLHRLADAGLVRFTGVVCRWERLA